MKQKSILPKTIVGRYTLYKQEEAWGQSSSKKGIYLNKKTNTLVFIKIDTDSKSLLREYENQKFFYEQFNNLKDTDVIIPKPLEIIKTNNYAALVMEYLPGKSLVKANVTTRINAYMKVLRFMEKINTTSYISRKYTLRQKFAIWQLITLPYFLLKNLILYPSHTSLFLNSFGSAVNISSNLRKLTANWICHGDINVTNVFLYRKGVVLIDFALSSMSHRYFDMSRVLNSTWYQKGLHQEFWDRIVNEFRFPTPQQKTLKSFVVFNLLERLSQRYANINQEHFYLARLETMLLSLKNDHLKQLMYLLRKNGYREVSPIKQDEYSRVNGIISDRQGKKYFIKAAFGRRSYEYKSLFSEAQVTRYLSELTKSKPVKHNGYRLYVPSVARIINQDEIFCLITDYIEGKKLLDQHSETQADILLTTLALIPKLSSETRISSIRPYLKNYTREAILLSLPIRFIKAALLSPNVIPGLIKAFSRAILLFTRKTNNYGLVHADINLSNLILQKKAIYVTDWEETGWGISAYNTITPLCVHWQDQTLRNVLLGRLQKNGQKKITIPLLAYRTLMLFNQHSGKESSKRKRDMKLLKLFENKKLIKTL